MCIYIYIYIHICLYINNWYSCALVPGLKTKPHWYPGLNNKSSTADFQRLFERKGCPSIITPSSRCSCKHSIRTDVGGTYVCLCV